MHTRMLEQLIEQAKAGLDRARRAAESERGPLARIRARVLGDPTTAA